MGGRHQHFANDRSVCSNATRAIVLFSRFEADRPNSMSDSIVTKTYGTVSAEWQRRHPSDSLRRTMLAIRKTNVLQSTIIP
jgi:hypothetical protein